MSMQDQRQLPQEPGQARLKKPLNPSVLGTAKQAHRTEKGGRVGMGRRSEGRGHPPGGGRGGKASRG
ncbi:MAG: hypothetical protein HY690_19775 [Chloroflexi bacterium]|nr:hypothetical protein [Chloroflexota bacterium]